MSYQVSLAHEAEKVLDRLDRPTENRIRHRLSQLAENPFDSRLSAQLTERAGLRKSRVGWLAYPLHGGSRIQGGFVLTIDTRGQVYKRS